MSCRSRPGVRLSQPATATVAVVALGAATLSAVSGCYELLHRPEDERNIRRQFHVSASVPVVSFDSHPKSAGFFGREGLRIWAVFQFEDQQFADYHARLDDPAVWKPVSFLSYSPDRAHEYSERSLRWADLPIPPWIEALLRHWQHLPGVLEVDRGRYYCSAIVAERGARVDHRGGGYHYEWKYLGRSCSELDVHSAVILSLGVLDFETKRLYAHIAFSG